ncbi:alpha-L-fucosidase [Catalinimonas alkaloidigena]|uniref:alpha-L-fucosidase n=1 Tax=Catalinimonas alkaloidigena TaxID=1075417 RepID=UPI001FE0FD14|nr:alpha-L-fucosidase [Catalinimonas alkaloidigena]
MKKSLLLLVLTSLVSWGTRAQGNLHQQSKTYEWPTDPQVLAKLDHWRDQKFGMIIHWGIYAVPGIIESWSICSEDWIERDSTIAYEDYKDWYWGQSEQFNPVNFNPEQWATAAKSAGMRYVVFTTKHHDGFAMFDTQESDYKITNGPFKNDPRANVAKYVFDAFRKEDFLIGAYFSKPDWHTPYYWWPKYATADRNNNYDIRKHPWRWNQFKEYTYNQIRELTHDYGKVDILWLDGGWVRPLETVNDEVRAWGADIPEWSQDIDMPRIAEMAREAQPGLLIVDRTVHGPYENYQTPEQQIPAEKIDHPWESCITLGHAWGYVPDQHFKSPAKVIHNLIEVVAKGGSLLLGVGPKPDGTLEEEVITRLAAIGDWLDQNGAAIYETRPVDQYRDGSVYFTQHKSGKTHYALVPVPEGEALPATISWTGNVPKKGSALKLLATGTKLKWQAEGNRVTVTLPEKVRQQLGTTPALALSFTHN